MSAPLATPFTGNAGSMLPDGVVTGNRKCKQAFSLNDPDNIELARLATQAANKKAKLSKKNNATNQKSGPKLNRQPSIEEVEDTENTRQRVFPRNPKNILESDDDDVEMTEATKKVNLSKPRHSKKKKLTITEPPAVC
jgi:hypothetical protein